MDYTNLTLRRAAMEDADILLEWRNDPVSRAMFLNQDLVAKESHIVWLERTLKDPRRLLFIALNGGIPVGQVRLDIEEAESEISLTVAPEHRGKGLAQRLIGAAVKWFRQPHPRRPILAVIKADNEASKRAFARSGFVWRDTAVVRGVSAERWYLGACDTEAAGPFGSKERNKP